MVAVSDMPTDQAVPGDVPLLPHEMLTMASDEAPPTGEIYKREEHILTKGEGVPIGDGMDTPNLGDDVQDQPAPCNDVLVQPPGIDGGDVAMLAGDVDDVTGIDHQGLSHSLEQVSEGLIPILHDHTYSMERDDKDQEAMSPSYSPQSSPLPTDECSDESCVIDDKGDLVLKDEEVEIFCVTDNVELTSSPAWPDTTLKTASLKEEKVYEPLRLCVEAFPCFPRASQPFSFNQPHPPLTASQLLGALSKTLEERQAPLPESLRSLSISKYYTTAAVVGGATATPPSPKRLRSMVQPPSEIQQLHPNDKQISTEDSKMVHNITDESVEDGTNEIPTCPEEVVSDGTSTVGQGLPVEAAQGDDTIVHYSDDGGHEDNGDSDNGDDDGGSCNVIDEDNDVCVSGVTVPTPTIPTNTTSTLTNTLTSGDRTVPHTSHHPTMSITGPHDHCDTYEDIKIPPSLKAPHNSQMIRSMWS